MAKVLIVDDGLVVISGTGQFQLQMAEALGAAYTIAKPLDAGLLVDAVERALADSVEERQEAARRVDGAEESTSQP